jgi:hypothetical protein
MISFENTTTYVHSNALASILLQKRRFLMRYGYRYAHGQNSSGLKE